MSWKTAPVGEVTTPMRCGKRRQRPLARLLEQALLLQARLQALELHRQDADAFRLDEVDIKLQVAADFVEGDAPVRDDLRAALDHRRQVALEGGAAEEDAAELGLARP